MLDKVVLDKLAMVEQRSEELELQMADPEVAGEYSRLEGVIKEHSSLRHIVRCSVSTEGRSTSWRMRGP